MKRLYLALAAAGAFLLLPLGLALSTCSTPPAPPHAPAIAPSPAAVSTAQATATASQSVRVTITRKPASQDAPQATKQGGPGGLSLDDRQGGSTAPTEAETITIEVSQAVGVAAASVSADHFADASNMVPDHARLGVALLTAPGILMADYQLLRLDASPLSRPALGVDLELGLDVAGNAQVAALGVTAGGKAFAGGYAWSRWDLGAQGIAAGIGLRF